MPASSRSGRAEPAFAAVLSVFRLSALHYRNRVIDPARTQYFVRRIEQRRTATSAQIAAATPKGYAPCRNPYAEFMARIPPKDK